MVKMWILRRMRTMQFDVNFLSELYTKEIRPILEYAVPVWHSGLTKEEAHQIENVQKCALKIILCNQYYDYSYACSVFGIQSLEERRFRLCTKFAVKEYRREGSMFTKYRPKYSLKNYRTKLVDEIFCNSSRYYNSSLPFLSRLLNSISNDPS